MIAQAMAGDPEAMIELRRIDAEMADREALHAEWIVETETSYRVDARATHLGSRRRAVVSFTLSLIVCAPFGLLVFAGSVNVRRAAEVRLVEGPVGERARLVATSP